MKNLSRSQAMLHLQRLIKEMNANIDRLPVNNAALEIAKAKYMAAQIRLQDAIYYYELSRRPPTDNR